MSQLNSLLVSEKQADEKLILDILQPYVRIGKDTGLVIPNEAFNRLSVKSRLLVYLVGRKAAKLKGIATQEATSLEVVASSIGEPLKYVRETESRLKKRGLVSRDKSGYFVPNTRLMHVKAFLASAPNTRKKKKTKKKS